MSMRPIDPVGGVVRCAFRSSPIALALFVALAPAAASAQSTEHLLTRQNYGRFEAALGRELVGDVYSGSVTGVYGAYRAVLENNSGWRLMGWSLWRDRRSTDSNGQPVDIQHRSMVIGAGPELRIALPARRTWAVGFLGAGYARVYASHPEFYYSSQDFQKSGNGWAILGGFGVTLHRVVIQQHIVVIHGAMNTLQVNREYYPVMLGVRF